MTVTRDNEGQVDSFEVSLDYSEKLWSLFRSENEASKHKDNGEKQSNLIQCENNSTITSGFHNM
jgi:hypothetical protein